MLELPITAKIVPILLAGLIMMSPIPLFPDIQQPDYGITPPNDEYSPDHYEIGYQISDGSTSRSYRDLYIYISPNGEFGGWLENKFIGDKLIQKSSWDNDNPPLKKEEKIINYWREQCKEPSKVIERIKKEVK